MPQLVFIHGPGAGGCADAYEAQLKHFKGSVAPTLPGHLEGERCTTIKGYVEWVRGWLWAQGLNKDLVLCGYTLGHAIAIQYGLDHPEEVKAVVSMSGNFAPVVPGPIHLDLRLRAADGDEAAYKEWFDFQRNAMHAVAPELRERLMERHRQVGPLSQFYDLETLCTFDPTQQLESFKPKLLVLDSPEGTHNREAMAKFVPGSTFIKMSRGGHFAATESPEEFNGIVERFLATL